MVESPYVSGIYWRQSILIWRYGTQHIMDKCGMELYILWVLHVDYAQHVVTIWTETTSGWTNAVRRVIARVIC